MKKLIISILILITININAQEEEIVVLPVDIARKILIDLEEKDNLKYRLSIKDSIISVYKTRINKTDSLLSLYKLNEEDYKSVINQKDQVIHLYLQKEEAYKEKEKIYKRKIKNGKVREKIGFGAAILAILLSVVSNN